MESGAADEYEALGLGDRVRKYKRKIDPDMAYDENRDDGCPLLSAGALTNEQVG
jgi:hypothetical protein